MKDPRYSIIPAGAVTDDRLEGRDLQVLCFLGCHTDKLGWCFLSQVGIAEKLGCGRSTVQRSLTRLYDAGWVELKTATESGHPHACHAYRVILDRDDPKIGPSEFEVEDQKRDAGNPPVGTHDPPVGTPNPPAGRGAQPYVGTERSSKKEDDDDGVARARVLSEDCFEVAREIGVICGYATPADWPIGWSQAHYRVQTWLNAGWQHDDILAACCDAMARKRDGPPNTLNYFDKPIASWIARRDQPLPEVKVQERETVHVVRKTESPARDEFRTALGELKDFNRGSRARSGGGGAALKLLPPDRDG